MSGGSKRLRKATAEDLYKGAYVHYDGDRVGVVSDSFASLNEFWINNSRTGQPVRDEFGAKRTFCAEELEVQVKEIEKQQPQPSVGTTQTSKGPGGPAAEGVSQARVLLIGPETHMARIIRRFGETDNFGRRDVQMLLALPCDVCRCGPDCKEFDATKLSMCTLTCPALKQAMDGVEDPLLDLARSLRPDIMPAVRIFHLKQAYENMQASELEKLDGYYSLTAVTLPHGIEEIKAATNKDEIYYMREVRCQVDLNASAEAFLEEGETALEAAQRALIESCSIQLSAELWAEETQIELRKAAGVDLPLKMWDGSEVKVWVVLLPEVATCEDENADILKFKLPMQVSSKRCKQEPGQGKKTTTEWREEQDQFKNLPALPKGWIRVKSKAGKVYFWNAEKQQSSYEFPLPEGWTKQVSKTNGQTYYFNAKKRKSQFDRPKEE